MHTTNPSRLNASAEMWPVSERARQKRREGRAEGWGCRRRPGASHAAGGAAGGRPSVGRVSPLLSLGCWTCGQGTDGRSDGRCRHTGLRSQLQAPVTSRLPSLANATPDANLATAKKARQNRNRLQSGNNNTLNLTTWWFTACGAR